MIPFIDLQKQYRRNRDPVDRQIREVLDSSAYVLGEKVESLEHELARFTGAQHAIGVGSGTDALMLALMALNLRRGDEVITTPFSFIATAEAIALVGATPVFAEIDPATFNICPRQIERAITPRTRAIITVDLFGQCADYDDINRLARRHGIAVIEDAAQAFGAEQAGRKACTFGDISCTSFYPAKPLGCYGDGGMVFTDSGELAGIMRSLRVHGQGRHRYESVRVGLNARLDAIQAAVLLGKMPVFEWELQQRREVAERYSRAFAGTAIAPPHIRAHNNPAWAQYSIRVGDRERLRSRLEEEGIPTCVFYSIPLHLQKAFDDLGYKKGDFPIAEAVAGDIMSLPMHPYLEPDTQEFIIDTLLRLL